MRPILLIFSLCLAGDMGSFCLRADPDIKDTVPEKIAALPWDTLVNVHAMPGGDAQIVITAHYARSDWVDDTDTSYIRVRPIKTTVDKDGRLRTETSGSWGQSKCRDFVNGWCNGSGYVLKADKNGFDYHLSLSGQHGSATVIKFDETFHGLWVGEQTFKKDGLTITLTVQVK